MKSVTSTAIVAILPLFSMAPANATDLNPKEEAQLREAGYMDWTGVYATVFGGWAWADWEGSLEYDDANPGDGFDGSSRTIEDNNWFVGGGIGGDHQIGRTVFGVVVDAAYSELGETKTVVPYPEGDYTWDISTEIEYFGTARGRIGYLLKPEFLAYATGGLAWAQVDSSITPYDDGEKTASATAENNHLGWTAGTGFEWRLSDRVSITGEYLYIDLGEQDYRHSGSKPHGNGIYATDHFSTDLDMHTVKGGASYRF